MNKIGTMILYSTQCNRFIHESIKQCKKFSTKVCIVTSDKSFDGRDTQNRQILDNLYSKYKNDDVVSFHELQWSNEIIFDGRETYSESMKKSGGWLPGGWVKGWYGISRYSGFLQLKPFVDFTLFLDADEIIDGDAFKSWMECLSNYKSTNAFKFLNYWYLNEVTLQATRYEDSIIMIRNDNYPEELFFTDAERHGMCDISLNRLENITYNGYPMIHHYSYVRNKEALDIKMKNTHGLELEIESSIDQKIDKIMAGIDIVHGYQYITVENKFNI